MNSEIKLTTQTEKPNHYTYLKEFRVEQCPSFLQHKCNQRRPFVCFNWHFMNQRRRRPVRRRDGTFNYSADNYCTKYDETTGICPDGDECPFLHRTAGDTERRYHLRYYKTCMCVHDTDSRGYCVKNGHHCAFAHGVHDQRPPVYDIKELEALQNAENNVESANGPNVLDKERNLMNEDPKWQDTNYVLANYKTEPCKRPPRLCRQGYACPQYHNSKDKRRSPRKYKYRSTPCPNVKHGEEWGEPANCESGDNCQYCHTRTEQQFHPEIYKSTKCNDVQQAGYCPRSVFCAFAHVEPYVVTTEEMPQSLDEHGLGKNPLGIELMVSQDSKKDKTNELAYFSKVLQNGSAESSESASTSSIGSNNSSHNKAPGAQLQKLNNLNASNNNSNLSNNNSNSTSSTLTSQQQNSSNLNNGNSLSSSLQSTINNNSANSTMLSNPFQEFSPEVSKQILAIENDHLLGPLEKEHRKRLVLYGGLRASNIIDEISRRMDVHIENSLASSILNNSSAPINIPVSSLPNSMTGLLQGGTAPVNIPGSTLNNFSPTNSNLFNVSDPFNHSHLSGSAPKINNSFGHSDSLFLTHSSHMISPLKEGLSISPDIRMNFDSRIPELNSLNSDLTNNTSTTNNLFDNHMQQNKHSFSISPLVNPSYSEITRLRDELANKNVQMVNWEEQVQQAKNHVDVYKQEVEEQLRKVSLVEKQRDDALGTVKALTARIEELRASNFRSSELRGMPIQKLKSLQSKLRSELEEVENVLYSQTATKCMKCEENNRSVTLVPCNHYVLCETCATTQRECPYCQTPVTSTA